MIFKDDTESKLNQKRLRALLSPSWLSGIICIIAGLIVTFGVITIFNINNNVVKQQLVSLEKTTSQQPTLTVPGQVPPGSNNNSLQNTWPLLAFWGVIGLLAYIAIESAFNFIREFKQFSEELNYVHAKRDLIIRTSLEYLLIRVGAAILWIIYLDIFFKKLVPLAILAAHAASTDFLSISGLLNATFSFLLVIISLHINAIFLRLILRRPRVFTKVDYLDV